MSESITRKKVDTSSLEFKAIPVDSLASFRPEEATDTDGTCYLRDGTRKVVYVKTAEGYACVTCGNTVMAARIAHPIWDGPFPMSGSGRVHSELVPYCPHCEEQPSYCGSPISVGPKY